MKQIITLKINNHSTQVPEGTSVMKAAGNLGINIPNMCWHEELEHFSSCMVCMVKDQRDGKLIPSCSVKATEGMEISTDDAEVIESRRTALELLLSEHVGDCEAPCQIACPAHMDIPQMNRLISAGKMDEALELVRRDIALPEVLGRICPAPCEGACHRKTVDEAVSICLLKRIAGEQGVESREKIIDPAPHRVAIIGAGPAGLSAAWYLQNRGVQVSLFDKEERPGGLLRGAINDEILPKDVLDREIDTIMESGIEFVGAQEIGAEEVDELKNTFGAIILATGVVSEETAMPGIKSSPKGYLVDRKSYQTSDEKVFAIGNALRSSRLAVRSVGQGKEVAYAVWQMLNGENIIGEPRLFNSRFGKLIKDEYAEYLKESVEGKRVWPEGRGRSGFTQEEAIREAKRCLHCDCRAVDNCKLREYADQYHADQKRFKPSDRRSMTKNLNHGSVVYEAEKCIKCGICVRLTGKYRERFGFTYIGRGFDVEIGVPFNESLKEGLTDTALKVAQACPTGAISPKSP